MATPVLIKACLNGSRAPGTHPALPLSPAQLARDAVEAAAAGAGAVHIHPRAADGSQSHAATDVGAALRAIREAVPGLPVGVTTGAWIVNDAAKRLQQVSEWRELPDFASVNWFEAGATELAELLIEMGVGVEAGLSNLENTAAFAAGPLARRCLRVLVEVRERDGLDAVTLASRMDAILDQGWIGVPRLHHGFGADTWRVIAAGFDKGWDVRIGLEDTLTLPDGSEAAANAALVAAAVAIAREHGREPQRVTSGR
jgi:uncharacterized protein (DUF849 family)